MDGDSIDLRSFLELLRRRIRLILLIIAAALGVAGIALLVLQPVYTATALVLVDPSKKNLLDPETAAGSSMSDSARVDSEVELARAEAVLLAAARELDLAADPEFRPAPGLLPAAPASAEQALQRAVARLREAVTVQRRGLTFLIAVSAQSARPDFAARIANAVAGHYIAQQLDAKVAATLAQRDIIQGRIAAAGAAIAVAGDGLEAEIARTNYGTLLTRLRDLDVQASLQVADSRIAAPATPPLEPSFPMPRTVLLVAVLVGLALGIGAALLAENLVGGITSEAQAEALLKVPVIAATPRQRPGRQGQGALSVADTLLLAPLSAYAESVRRIRIGLDHAINRARGDAEPQTLGIVVMVASATTGEGKTTVALSLARTYAQSGLSTLLVDCDLRQPSVHRQLGMEPSEGLFDYLVGSDPGLDLKSIMTVDPGSGAQIVLGSRRSDIATDQLIAGRTLHRLIGAARDSFDVVILDTPPIVPVVDGLYLAGLVDAILFVVKWSSTPQREARAAISSLFTARAETTPVLAVLNQRDTNPRAYRGKYAGSYAEA